MHQDIDSPILKKALFWHVQEVPVSLNWEEAGKEKKPTVILVHGAGASAATWTLQLRGLSKHCHVVALELNGHGRSQDKSDKAVADSYLDDIDQVVSMFQTPILGGHSMGGALTQLYALRHPEKLGGIILVGTGARLRVTPVVFELLDTNFEGYIEALGEFMFHQSASKELIEASQQEARKCPKHIIRRDFELCDHFDIMERVSEIMIPTLIIVGDDDVMTPLKFSNYLNEKIKNSKLQTVKSAGHMVMLEQPLKVNSAIRKWIESSI